MPKIKSWEVSDSFWNLVEPLIPPPERDQNKEYKQIVWWRTKTDAIKKDLRRHYVCPANRLSVASLAKRTFWQSQCHLHPFCSMAA